MWCGQCYTSDPGLTFQIKTLQDHQASINNLDQKELERLTLAWGKKHRNKDDFKIGRDGDHTLIPFECDSCIFRKLKRRDPELGSSQDDLLLICIRRINLDAMWSSATLTVKANRSSLNTGLKMSESVGLQGSYEHMGPLPYYDHCGYETAIQTILFSRKSGRHSTTYTQYDTIRKLRTAFSNQVRAAPQSNKRTLAIGDTAGTYQRLGEDACGSFWYYRFNKGLKCRMG